MKVTATAMGYYDHIRRRPGDVFELIGEADYSAKWMKPVPADTAERRTSAQDALTAECRSMSPLGIVQRRAVEEPEAVGHVADFDPFDPSLNQEN
jgi:hypothetical protein